MRWFGYTKVVLCASWLVAACSGGGNPPTPTPPSPGQWSDYGGTEPAINGNSFAFPTNSSGTAGYFYTKIGGSVGQTVTLNYSIIGNNPVWAQHPQSGSATDTDPASITLFLWRNGDDLGGGSTGKASYRFWCPQRALLAVGDYQMLCCKLDPNVWTNVDGKVDPNGFAAALSNALGLGFTFGGANFYGHGVYLQSGNATFVINSFTIQ